MALRLGQTLPAAAGLVLAFGSSLARANHCDALIGRSDAVMQTLSTRAEGVERCLALASELEAAAYRNTFGFCRNFTLNHNAPSAITMPSGEVITPAPSVSWEEFAAQLGDTSAKAGCRDGVLSAYQQTLFASTARLQALFSNTGMSLEDSFIGRYSLAPAGELLLSHTLIEAQFTEFSGIRADGEGHVSFESVPMILKVTADARFETLLGTQDFTLAFGVSGSVSGMMDGRSLDVRIDALEVNEVHVGPGTIFPQLVAAIMKQELQANKAKLGERVGAILGVELKRAYRATDPFHFLSNAT